MSGGTQIQPFVPVETCDDPFSDLSWTIGSDDQELRDGLEAGQIDARENVTRAEFLDLIEALQTGTIPFVRRLQRTEFIRAAGVSREPIRAFVDRMFGRLSGGVHGPYAAGYVRAFEMLAPFVRSLH